MRVKPAVGNEEDLALHAQRTSSGNHLRHLLQLLAEIVLRELGLERRDVFQGIGKHLRELTALAAWTMDKPLSKVSNCWLLWKRACEAAELSNPIKPGTWPGFIEKGREVTPVQKMGLPEIERIGGNCALVLKVCTLSATLPAHPAAVIPESCAVCHWSC